jgi:RND family efflux transporter MFP subunit
MKTIKVQYDMKTFSFKIIVIALAVSVISCGGDKQSKLVSLKKKQAQIAQQIKELEAEIAATDSTKKENANAKVVGVTELKSETFKHFIEIQGKLDGDENVGISAKVGGVVDAVYVNVGDRVSKGQLLAKLDDKLLEKNMADLKTKLEFATDMYNKQKNLWDQKIGSEVQYLTAKNTKESLENAIRTLDEQIDMYRITSPIAGTVGDAPIKVGQAVSPGLPAFRVINFNKLKVVADVAEAYAVKVSVGDDVQIFFPDLNEEVPARISAVSQYINPVSRTFQIEVQLKQSHSSFKANMIAVLKINDYLSDKTIVLPINMVQTDANGSFVYVMQANSSPVAKRINVKTGQSYNGLIEIKEGLKPGDKIISSGYLDVEDGQPVKF